MHIFIEITYGINQCSLFGDNNLLHEIEYMRVLVHNVVFVNTYDYITRFMRIINQWLYSFYSKLWVMFS